MAVALLQDMSKCIACKGCQVACKEWNELPAEPTRNGGSYENPRDLSPTTWTRVQFLEEEENGEPRWRFFKQQCMHCASAPCAEVCPTAALKRHPLGFVSLERDLCNGCGYCAGFCPYGVPRLTIESALSGRAKIAKCTFCEDRVTNGQAPACAKTCPSGAIQFGDRQALLGQGRARAAELRAQGHPRATLYGETEMGGLGVLYVLPESPSRYPSLPVDPDAAWRTASLWQRWLQPIGVAGLVLGVLGLVANFATVARRQPGAEEQQEARHE
jgi:formate dehydrogenase iron-sulfur subunit